LTRTVLYLLYALLYFSESRLKTIAAAEGFRLFEIAKNGNCFFAAIASQLSQSTWMFRQQKSASKLSTIFSEIRFLYVYFSLRCNL